jgi:cytidine deaminase
VAQHDQHKELVQRAVEAKSHAYAPYSRFRVGAALLTDDGSIFQACNVENSSFSLTICAERNAVFQAVSHGRVNFRSIAIASDSKEFLPPCGACRQVLAEFNPSIEIILTTSDGRSRVMSLAELFPLPTDLRSLARKLPPDPTPG